MAFRIEYEWYKMVQLQAMRLLIPHAKDSGATGEARFAGIMEEVVLPMSQAFGRAILGGATTPAASAPEWRVSVAAKAVADRWKRASTMKR